MSSNTIVTELRQWKFTLDQHQYGLGAGWATEQYDDSFWSPVERFGAAFLDAQLKIFMEDENMRGMVIWSWADYRHRRSFIGGGMHLSATYGPFGMVTIDRKVKEPIFNVMKDFYINWNP